MKKVILFMAGILVSMMLNAQSRWSVTPSFLQKSRKFIRNLVEVPDICLLLRFPRFQVTLRQ